MAKINAKTTGGGGIETVGDASGVLELQSDGTTRQYIDASGNVGIGTSSPANKLQINDGAASTMGVVRINNPTNANNNYGAALLFSNENGGVKYDLGQVAAFRTNNDFNYDGALAFYSATNGVNAERMRIDASGSLGIGSTNPSYYGKLTVNGAIAQVAAAGSYTIDVTANSSSVANGGTIDFPNMSGMIIVNSATSASIAIWLVSGGSTSAVSNVNGATGTMTYVSGIAGYRWTNNTGSANTVAFFCVRTRGTA